RDVHADISGRRVARERSLVAALRLHVAEAIVDVADVHAPARAHRSGKLLRVIGREAIERGQIAAGRKRRELTAAHRLDLVADLVDRHGALALPVAEPPGADRQRRAHQHERADEHAERDDERAAAHARRLSGTRRSPSRSVPRPVVSSYSASVKSWNVAARLKRASKSPLTRQYGTSPRPSLTVVASTSASLSSL